MLVSPADSLRSGASASPSVNGVQALTLPSVPLTAL